jgi:hypothetical protein
MTMRFMFGAKIIVEEIHSEHHLQTNALVVHAVGGKGDPVVRDIRIIASHLVETRHESLTEIEKRL